MSAAPVTTRTTPTTPRVLQAAAVLQVLVIASQFVTAGRLFGPAGPEGLHAAGAIALHVVGLVAAAAAVVAWRRQGAPVAVAVLAVAVWVAGFVQAATGGRDTLAVHVPFAMLLTVGAVWLVAEVLRRRPAPTA